MLYKENICQCLLDEGHLYEIFQLSVDRYLSPWLTLHKDVPYEVKKIMCQKKLTEAHLVEIYELCVNTYLSPWLTTEDIRDIADMVVKAGYEKKYTQQSVQLKLQEFEEFQKLVKFQFMQSSIL